MVKGAALGEHGNPGEASVHVLAGRVRLSAGQHSACRPPSRSWRAPLGEQVRRAALAAPPEQVEVGAAVIGPERVVLAGGAVGSPGLNAVRIPSST
jgi:hypothetical protein